MVKKKKPKKAGVSWAAIGFDVSMTSISGAAIGWDSVLGKNVGPEFVSERWESDTHYFTRLSTAVAAHLFVWELKSQLGLFKVETENTFIAIEEPWPMGMIGKGKFQSAFAKQQAQIQGAFLASLVRYGYQNVFEINNSSWRKLVADDLGITTHYSKWDKFKPKEWAIEFLEIEHDFPDLIRTKKGLVPRPEGSRAKAVQPDDRYDALPMAMWVSQERVRSM